MRGTRAIALFLSAALFGCSSSGGGMTGAGDDDQGQDPEVAAACLPDAAIPSSDQTWTLSFGGLDRTYKLHVPPGYDRAPTALVFNFHGFTSSAAQQEYFSEMDDTADREGFAVAYPQGTGTPPSWNAGACCGSAAASDLDDVGFVSAMIDDVSRNLCIDPKRVYATGFSNGGFLSHRLACELSDRIAAVAPVAGVIGIDTCAPSRPMPVLAMHGTLDPLVPIDGNPGMGFPSLSDTMLGWSERDGCAGDPVTTFDQGDTHCEAWQTCDGGAAVETCIVDGGGHTWPGGLVPAALGYTSQDLHASDKMWTFFAAHPMP